MSKNFCVSCRSCIEFPHFLLAGYLRLLLVCIILSFALDEWVSECGKTWAYTVWDPLGSCLLSPKQVKLLSWLIQSQIFKLSTISSNETAILVNFIMDVIHADRASNVIIKVAGLQWVWSSLRPLQCSLRHTSVVIVWIWVDSIAPRHEPTSAPFLLKMNDN